MKNLAFMILFFAFSSAEATVVYDQSYDPSNPMLSDQASDIQANQKLADNFKLDVDSKITHATIFGTFWADGVVPSSPLFSISFSYGTFANKIFESSIAPETIVDTGFDHNSVPGADILAITFDLGTLDLKGFGMYWFGAQAIDDSPNIFKWERIDLTGLIVVNDHFSRVGNRAFNLQYNPRTIPEPSAIALMGLGLLGFGVTRCKKKKN